MRYWIVKAALFIPMAFMFVTIGSEGLRRMWPILGQRLHRVPGLGFLEDSEDFHRFDGAHFCSLVIVTSISFLWDSLIEALIFTDLAQMDHDPSVHSVRNRTFLFVFGPLFIFAEAVLFFRGAQHSGAWSSAAGSFDAFIGTIVYLSMIVAVSYFSVKKKYPHS